MRRPLRFAGAVAAPLILGGCGLPLGVQVASLLADGVSVLTTDKTITDHAVSKVTEKDCAMWRAVEGDDICRKAETGETLVAEAGTDTSAGDLDGADEIENWSEPADLVAEGRQTPQETPKFPSEEIAAAPAAPLPTRDTGTSESAVPSAWTAAVTHQPLDGPEAASISAVSGVTTPDIPPAPEMTVAAVPPPAPQSIPAPPLPPSEPAADLASAGEAEPALSGISAGPDAVPAAIPAPPPAPMPAPMPEKAHQPLGGTFYVIASYRRLGDAWRFTDRHTDVKARVLEGRLKGRPIYRIAVGPVTKPQRRALKTKLKRTGFKDTWALTLKAPKVVVEVASLN